MAKKFSELRNRMSPEAQEKARVRALKMLAEMPLQELRRARELSQATLAQALGANQPQISKIEHSTDLYLSTLRRYIEAIGGELEIIARFPDGVVRVSQFEELNSVEGSRSALDTWSPAVAVEKRNNPHRSAATPVWQERTSAREHEPLPVRIGASSSSNKKEVAVTESQCELMAV